MHPETAAHAAISHTVVAVPDAAVAIVAAAIPRTAGCSLAPAAAARIGDLFSCGM